eukprot:1373460-Amphidinium_carterae.1
MANHYVPKKGKARMIKRPGGYKRPSSSSYVRHPNKPGGTRHANDKDRVRPTMTITKLHNMNQRSIRQMLIKMRLMKDNRTTRFTRCSMCHRVLTGKAGSGKPRCNHRQCFMYRKCIHEGAKIFTDDDRSHPLKTQALIAYGAVVGMKQCITHLCFDVNHKSVERVYNNLHSVMACKVRDIQEGIKFNATKSWVDVEADEVILRKTSVGDNKVQWLSYLGLVKRGCPSSLVLIELEHRVTKKRSPGPGPLRSSEWKKIGQRYVEDQYLILHTDSAKAYNEEFKQLLHTRVVHMKKKVNGQWLLPKYTEDIELTLPDGGTLSVKSGTQFIDGLWRLVKESIRPLGCRFDGKIDDMIRVCQWRYWNQGKCPWKSVDDLMQT